MLFDKLRFLLLLFFGQIIGRYIRPAEWTVNLFNAGIRIGLLSRF